MSVKCIKKIKTAEILSTESTRGTGAVNRGDGGRPGIAKREVERGIEVVQNDADI